MRKRNKLVLVVTVCVLFVAGGIAQALISADFTPVNLVEQAELILMLRLSAPNAKGEVKAEIAKCLKGEKKAPKGPLTIDLTITAMKEHAKKFGEMLKTVKKDEPVLMFVGTNDKDEDISLIHMRGRWYSLDATDKPELWDFHQKSSEMEATWAGGTDMLLRITELLLKYPDMDVPVRSGVSWDEHSKAASLKGKITEALAPDLDGKGKLHLFLAGEAGDHLFLCDVKANKLKDVTADHALATKSLCATWADFNTDGRLDLASWDGKALGICLQGKDGKLAAATTVEGVPAGKCLGLAVLDTGTPGRPGLLLSGEKGPVLLKQAADGKFAAAALALGGADVAALGEPNRCLVGDIDSDGIVDVIWPGAKGSLFFKGTAVGAFAEPVKKGIVLGRSPSGSYLGDFDMDGRFDVYSVSDDRWELWHNRTGAKAGEFRFEGTVHISGEAAYIAKAGGLCGNACDVNNDGRQDLFWVYSAQPGQGPHIFFNRGFRSFGHAHMIDVSERTLLNLAEKQGQQNGIIADFNGDGAQDMAFVLKNGDLYFFPRSVGNADPLAVRARLPLGGKVTGPVKVTGWNNRRCLGAWNVVAGTQEGFFGQMEPGEIKLKWRLPGEDKDREAKAVLDDEDSLISIDLLKGK